MQELAQQMQEEKQRIEDMLRTLKSCPETCGVQTWVKLTGNYSGYRWIWIFRIVLLGSLHLLLTAMDFLRAMKIRFIGTQEVLNRA